MVYLNENDGLYYTDEAFTTLANGWNSNSNIYYVNGQDTTLDENGNGFWSDKAYSNGSEQPTGWNGYFYYIDNVQTPLNENGHSSPEYPYDQNLYNGKYYMGGVPYTGADLNGALYMSRKFTDGLPSSGYAESYFDHKGFYDENGFPMQGWFTVAQGAPDTNGRGGTYFWNSGPGATTLDENGSGWYEPYGAYYINNVEYYGPDSTGTGWAANQNAYLINGQITTLDSNGTGFWSDKAYSNGSEQPTGWNGYFYYIDNAETTLDSNGTGWDSNSNVYYIGGSATSLDSNGNGFWDSKAYLNGSEQPTGWNEYFYYIDNVETTLDSNGDGEWNSQTYVNGVVQNGGGGGGGSVNLTSGLQAFYKLSDTSDSSGNNRTLTNNGNVSFASGKIGNAAVFDGTNSLTTPVPQPSEEMSISAWVYLNDTNGYNWVVDSVTGNNWNGGGLGLVLENGTVNSYVFYGDTMENLSVSSPNPLNAGEWYHLVGTHVAATGIGKLFINGSLVSTNTFSNTSPFGGDRSNPISIGSNADGVFALFNGSIDAVGIWNRALSDSEVAALYNSGTGLELPAPTGPTIKNGWITDTYWINDVATTLDQNGDGKWQGKLYEGGTLFSGTKYSLTFVDGLAQPENIVTVIGNNIPVAFGLNEAEEPLVELVFASITSAGETTVEQIVPTVLPTGYTVAETVLAYSIDTTATFEGSINVDFILPSNISQAVFDRVKSFHVKNSGAIEEMTRVSSDFSTKRITVAITSFSDFLFLDEPPANNSVKVVGKSKFVGKIKFA